jgi:hypothetical protein
MIAKGKIAAAAAAGVAVVAGGGAIAATQLRSPQQESQAVVDDAAKQLGVDPSKLSSALKKALENRVDAAVQAGRLTQEEGDRLKAAIESGSVPLVGVPLRGFGEHGPFREKLDTAASYLGLSDTELHSQLESGKTLAQIARDRGKSVDGLVDALVADDKEHLDAAVAAGRLTKSDEQQMLAGLRDRITNLVNGRLPAPPFEGRGFGGPRFEPPGGHGPWS